MPPLILKKGLVTGTNFITVGGNGFPRHYSLMMLFTDSQPLVSRPTVESYLEAFEELRAYVAAMNPNLGGEYFISSFISCLKEDIKGQVRMARPSSFTETVQLAKQAEANHAKSRTTLPFFKQQTSQPNTFNQPKLNTYNYTKTPFPNPVNRNPNPSQTVSRQRTLTSNEIVERWRKGLCFHCDEKYGNGHVCKMKLYTLSGEGEERENNNDDMRDEIREGDTEVTKEDCHISIQTISRGMHTVPLR